MAENILVKLFEHNNWANIEILLTCSNLSDELLDAEPQSATIGSIRQTLVHLANSQQGYLSLLSDSVEAKLAAAPAFTDLMNAVSTSGEGLLALAKDEANERLQGKFRTQDGYEVEPWVVMVQVINHATEHREQICSMFSGLGLKPPVIDGWTYGEFTKAVTPISP